MPGVLTNRGDKDTATQRKDHENTGRTQAKERNPWKKQALLTPSSWIPASSTVKK